MDVITYPYGALPSSGPGIKIHIIHMLDIFFSKLIKVINSCHPNVFAFAQCSTFSKFEDIE